MIKYLWRLLEEIKAASEEVDDPNLFKEVVEGILSKRHHNKFKIDKTLKENRLYCVNIN